MINSAHPPHRLRRRILVLFRITCHADSMTRETGGLKTDLRQIFHLPSRFGGAYLPHNPQMKRGCPKSAARWTPELKKLKAISIRQPWTWLNNLIKENQVTEINYERKILWPSG
jgi:hypothetical protein